MIEGGDDLAKWAALGLTADDLVEEEIGVWPDNMPIIEVFRCMATQWRSGFSGPTGLDYSALPFVMRTCGIKRSEWQDVFDGVRVAESVALDKWRQK